jgi:hypothetical protein
VPHESVKTIFHAETRREFSLALLAAMGVIGCIAYLLEMWLIRLVWRWRG